MSAINLAQEISDEFGLEWSDHSILGLLAEYIDRQESEDALEDFLRHAAEAELDEVESDYD